MGQKSGGRRMEYTLMHKDIPVMGLEIDSEVCAVRKIGEIYAPEHIPLGTSRHPRKNRSGKNLPQTIRHPAPLGVSNTGLKGSVQGIFPTAPVAAKHPTP